MRRRRPGSRGVLLRWSRSPRRINLLCRALGHDLVDAAAAKFLFDRIHRPGLRSPVVVGLTEHSAHETDAQSSTVNSVVIPKALPARAEFAIWLAQHLLHIVGTHP